MAKNLIITIYILTVLLFSVIARAEFSSFDNSMDSVIELNSNLSGIVSNPVDLAYATIQEGEITLPVQTEVFEGNVVFVDNGSYILVFNNGTYVYLNSQVDLSQFVGYDVIINGVLQSFKPASFTRSQSLDPLPGVSGEISVPSIYVIGISVR